MDSADAQLDLVVEEVFPWSGRRWIANARSRSGRPQPGMTVTVTHPDGASITTQIVEVMACAPPRTTADWAGVVLRHDAGQYLVAGSVIVASSVATMIYVYLPDEAVDVWRPVDAEDLGDGRYRLPVPKDYDAELERWEFEPGSTVECEPRLLDGGEYLVAVRRHDRVRPASGDSRS